ncbi:TIGR02206 family membrane protein [Bacillus sp. Marseille-Q3570]|uniref:YwaF family protein n=1 Tax=Bacillus sp. Marseille-Q3570 TaxID=2963522 RepID=UPI0021B7C26D|nr:TIGR02206 family membrane protein [Bacillus sp. Marseille-Q3570]
MFAPDRLQDFQLFSTAHLVFICVMFFTILLIFMFRKELRRNKSTKQAIRWGFLAILILSEGSYQLWSLAHGIWNPRWHLPLQLCSISAFAIIYLLLKPSEERFQVVYFMALIPPFLAVLTPDLLYGNPHYRFFQFFIHHITLLAAVFFYLIVEKYRPKRFAILKAALFINLLALPISYLNKKIGANYMFLEGPPVTSTPLSWFGEGLWYIVNLEIVMIVTFTLTYLPFVLAKRQRKTFI